jgi:hypothetical protein
MGDLLTDSTRGCLVQDPAGIEPDHDFSNLIGVAEIPAGW